jgi:predicted methyltransferase MtxX (methanogen marker protein 4)
MARRHRSTIYTEQSVDIEVDIDEVIDQITDEELINELKHRKLDEKARDAIRASDPLALLDEVVDWLRDGDIREAMLVLDRILHPKFSSLELCAKEFEARKSTS